MSIQRLHDRLDAAGRRAATEDTGLSMTEVITALFVFTVFILGLGYSLLSMTRLVSDEKNREVAASLASQEIDRVRAVPDAFDVLSLTTTQTVNGIPFTIKRYAGWVTASGSSASCGGGGGNLQDKAVDVQVSWPSQYVLTSPIRSTTVLAPTTRINDPSFGTIIVSVQGADGTGRGNVPVTVTADSPGTGVTPSSVDATDSTGCTYVLKVAPGAYTVKLNNPGYIDYQQNATPSKDLAVTAGGSQTYFFNYDASAIYKPIYAGNYTGTGASSVKLPTSLNTYFFNAAVTPIQFTTTQTTQNLYPFSQGYSTIAGNYTSSTATGCASVDPVNWSAGSVNGVDLTAGVRPQTGVAAGTSGNIIVPMGVIQATVPLLGSVTSMVVKGVTAPTGTGDPGCASLVNYTFTGLPPAGSTVYLAVPFGSWQVSSGTGSILNPVLTPLATGSATPVTQGELTGNTLTLDPRSPQ